MISLSTRILFFVSLLWTFPGLSFSRLSYDDFYNPIGLKIHSSGDLFIVDSGNQRIVVLNPEGELKHTFGRKGMGPGEFQHPCGLAFLSDEEVLVVDSDTRRIQVFSPEGKYLRLFLKPKHSVGLIYVTDKGQILITENDGIRFQFNMSDGDALTPVHVYNKAGVYQKGLGEGLTHENHFVMAQRNHGNLAWHGDRIVFARYVENKMEVFKNGAAKSYLYAPAFPPTEPDGKMIKKPMADGSVSFRLEANTQVHAFDLLALDADQLLMLRAMSEEKEGVVDTQLITLAWDGTLKKVIPGIYRAKKIALSPNRKYLYLLDENDDGWFIQKLAMKDLL